MYSHPTVTEVTDFLDTGTIAIKDGNGQVALKCFNDAMEIFNVWFHEWSESDSEWVGKELDDFEKSLEVFNK